MALLLSPLLHGNIFTKSYKTQILIWYLFYKTQILIWHLFCKAQILISHLFYRSPKCYFWQKQLLYAQSPKLFLGKIYTHGKNKLLISQKIFLSQNLWELCLFFHNQLTTKAHEYHPWQNFSFCSDNQAQRSSTTKPTWVSPAHIQIPAARDHVSWPAKFQHN